MAFSLLLGVMLGGISGLYGGLADTVIQRVIEIVRSIPTIPLWMGLAAALPNDWTVMQVYFAITIIISLVGWTELARVVRGRFLALREEDFVTNQVLSGANQTSPVFIICSIMRSTRSQRASRPLTKGCQTPIHKPPPHSRMASNSDMKISIARSGDMICIT